MENNKNNQINQNKKGFRNEQLEINNDQIGENASEEYRSEEYSNAIKNKANNIGSK